MAGYAPVKPEHNLRNQRADELYGTKANTTQKKRERKTQHRGLAMVKWSHQVSWLSTRKMVSHGRLWSHSLIHPQTPHGQRQGKRFKELCKNKAKLVARWSGWRCINSDEILPVSVSCVMVEQRREKRERAPASGF
jgi:hypothetical protein